MERAVKTLFTPIELFVNLIIHITPWLKDGVVISKLSKICFPKKDLKSLLCKSQSVMLKRKAISLPRIYKFKKGERTCFKT